mmetsp:Transcript_14017/g.40651  ORF Transcript_14017/g.40651 Transcript_14017/m.40651 type:complete len:209 (-) Transcript_14017:1954-2580(-)
MGPTACSRPRPCMCYTRSCRAASPRAWTAPLCWSTGRPCALAARVSASATASAAAAAAAAAAAHCHGRAAATTRYHGGAAARTHATQHTRSQRLPGSCRMSTRSEAGTAHHIWGKPLISAARRRTRLAARRQQTRLGRPQPRPRRRTAASRRTPLLRSQRPSAARCLTRCGRSQVWRPHSLATTTRSCYWSRSAAAALAPCTAAAGAT